MALFCPEKIINSATAGRYVTRRATLLAVFLSLLFAVPVGVAATTAGPQATQTTQPADPALELAGGSPGPAQQANNTTGRHNNSTVRQRNPAEINEDGDEEAVTSNLQSQLARLLQGSTVQLSQGQYEQADGLVGEEFEDALGKFVDVAGETDEGTTQQLTEAQDAQQDLVAAIQEFNATYTSYQEARANGNESRARTLARKLLRLEDQISGLTRDLASIHAFLENTSDVSLNESTERLQDLNNQTGEQAANVRETEFIETHLTVSAPRSQVSFADPIKITGHFQTANGSTLASQTIELAVGNRTTEVTTNQSGYFTFQYRPVRLATDTTNLSIRYLPSDTSIYLGSEATLPISVQAITPQIDVSVNPERGGFGDRISVTGTVTGADTPVPSVPVSVTMNGIPITQGTTNASGGINLTGGLPAAIPTGAQTLSIRVGTAGTAINATRHTQSLTVVSTPTSLSVQTEHVQNQIVLSGRLTSSTGTSVSDSDVAILVNGSLRTTATTDGNGTYQAVFAPPERLGETATVRVRYADSGSNLEASSAQTQISLVSTPSGSGSEAGFFPLSIGPFSFSFPAVAGGLGIAVVALGVVWWRSRDQAMPTESHPLEEAETALSDDSPGIATGHSPSLQAAKEQLSAGQADQAIEIAYGVTRAALAQSGIPNEGTHWQFFRRVADEHLSEDAFELLTRAYEQAIYSQQSPSEADAERALTAAGTVLDTAGDANQHTPGGE